MLRREAEQSATAVLPSPPPASPPAVARAARRWTWLLVCLGLCFIPLGLVLRSWAVNRALRVGQHTLRNVTLLLPQASADGSEEDYFPFFRFVDEGAAAAPLDPVSPNQSPPQQRPQAQLKKKGATQPAPPLGPQPQSTRASSTLVLHWANNKIIPRGRSRGAEYGLPAGIELSQTSGLGIGLLDGDRLLSVNGIPVQQRAQVVSEVLAARGRGEQTVVAHLVRRTKEGPKEFTVTVEQPYLTDAPPVAAQPETAGP